MPINTVAIAAILFGLILEVSAVNLFLKRRPGAETLPLAGIGLIFLAAGLFKLLA